MKGKKNNKAIRSNLDQLKLSLETQTRVAESLEQERDRAYDDYEMAQVEEGGRGGKEGGEGGEGGREGGREGEGGEREGGRWIMPLLSTGSTPHPVPAVSRPGQLV